jgi:hypothetical protein
MPDDGPNTCGLFVATQYVLLQGDSNGTTSKTTPPVKIEYCRGGISPPSRWTHDPPERSLARKVLEKRKKKKRVREKDRKRKRNTCGNNTEKEETATPR